MQPFPQPGIPKGNPFLFVYGTLMRGSCKQWPKRVRAEFVGRGVIEAELYDLGDYPGAKLSEPESGQQVKGEVYRLRDHELATNVLDEYEEFFPSRPQRSLFVRKLVSVQMQDGRKRIAWAYLYNRAVDKTKLIPSGDYRDRFATRP
jgi:gamma-glutamylcyclotransferase (GGCT)/AIG2-like uncharacterized protein YtfP